MHFSSASSVPSSTPRLPDERRRPSRSSYDAVVVGGGHNGLVAAAYLARAGRSVLVLELQDRTGGAAVSAQAFSGLDARLSRYSYLVSLLPNEIVTDLGLRFQARKRRVSSTRPPSSMGGRRGSWWTRTTTGPGTRSVNSLAPTVSSMHGGASTG